MVEEIWVIATTSHRDVWYGRLIEDNGKSVLLRDARHCHSWGKTYGLSAFAANGPGPGSRISAPAPSLKLRDVVATIECTPEAVAEFERTVWSDD